MEPEPAVITKVPPQKTESALAKRKFSFKEQREYESIEGELEILEKERNTLYQRLAGGLPYEEIQVVTNRLTDLTDQINQKELRWLQLTELVSP